MAKTTVRVELPAGKPDDIITLVEKILERHDAMEAETPGSSPVKAARVTKLRAVLASAKPDRKKAKDLAAESQALIEKSNKTLGLAPDQNLRTDGTGLNLISLIRDGLENDYAGNENELEKWGFGVVIGTAASPTKKSQGTPPA